MKNFYLLVISFMFAGLCFTACGDDDKGDGNIDGPDPDPDEIVKLPDTDMTPAEIKTLLQDESTALLKELEGLTSNEGLKTLANLAELIDFYDDDDYWVEPGTYSSAKGLTGVAQAITKSAAKDYYGTYTWSANEQEWDESENANNVIIEFPSNGKKGTNDAKVIAVAGNTTVTYEGYEVPATVEAEVYKGTTKVATMDIAVTWKDAKKAPEVASVEVDLIDYSIEAKVDKGSESKGTVSLKKGTEPLVSGTVTADTDFDQAINGTFNQGQATISISATENLVIAGNMDVKAYVDAERKLDDEYYENGYDEEKYYKGLAEAFNKNSDLVLAKKDGKDDEKLATIQAQAKKDAYYEYYDYWDLQYVLVFSDGSSTDLDTYFGSGFDKFINEFNRIIDKW